MGWFKRIETDEEKIDNLLRDFNVTYKYINSDGKIAILLDDVNQLLGYINIDYGSGKLETMKYSEIEAINYHINSKDSGGFFDLECMTKKEVEDFIEITKNHIRKTIANEELWIQGSVGIETMYRKREFNMSFCMGGIPKKSLPKSHPTAQDSINEFLKFTDLLSSAILMTKEGK